MNDIKPFAKVLFGSRLYGLETPDSDIDYKGIYLPTAQEIVLNRVKQSYNYNLNGRDKNLAGQDDYEIYSLDKFVKMAIAGETVAIDMLHSKNKFGDSEIWDYLVSHRTDFYSKNMNSFMGYLKSQFLKYGVKGDKLKELNDLIVLVADLDNTILIKDAKHLLPNLKYNHWTTSKNKGSGAIEDFYSVNGKLIQHTLPIKEVQSKLKDVYREYGNRAILAANNDGKDWKAISHALRAAYQLISIYKYGDYEYPLENSQYLYNIKTGVENYEEVVDSFDEVLYDIKTASEKSTLPEKCDKLFWDNFVFDEYKKIIIN